MSLPSTNYLHLTVCEIQSGQTFSCRLPGKVALTHLAMEIHLQTTDHVVAVEKVAAQHIGTKYSKCNSLEVISHIIILGKVLLLTQM